MSLGKKLRKLYSVTNDFNDYQDKREKRKLEAGEWVTNVLTPYLLNHAHEGRARIDSDLLPDQYIHDSIYHVAIEDSGVIINTYGRNYLGLIWS